MGASSRGAPQWGRAVWPGGVPAYVAFEPARLPRSSTLEPQTIKALSGRCCTTSSRRFTRSSTATTASADCRLFASAVRWLQYLLKQLADVGVLRPLTRGTGTPMTWYADEMLDVLDD